MDLETKNIEFIDPEILLTKTIQEMDGVPDDVLFNNPDKKYKDLRESWYAGMFGSGFKKKITPCVVHAHEVMSYSADFLLKINDKIYGFQCTDADDVDRKRGEEFKQRKQKTKLYFTPYRPQYNQDNALDWIFEKVEKKALKYGSSENLNLLFYLPFSVNEQLKINEIAEKLSPFEKTFKSIWALDNLYFCSVFPISEELKTEGWYRSQPERPLP